MPYGPRLSVGAHEAAPWRIREIAPDFTVEDVWALPVQGAAEDFQALLDLMVSVDPTETRSVPARLLWRVRELLGRLFGWDDAASDRPIPGTNETSLTERLPAELRNTATELHFDSLPFVPLYRTATEFAAEVSNQTVHGVIHLGWVDQGGGRYHGQLAVYVKPRGFLGPPYLALIKPFRYLIVYPALMRTIERTWQARVPQRAD